MAQRLSAAGPKAPLLARFDSGFDSVALMGSIEACNRTRATGLPQIDWLIKWNPRSTNVAALAQTLTDDGATLWSTPRAGKRLTLWEQRVAIEGVQRSVRRVLRLVERTIDAKGQLLIAPDYTLEGWTTTLPKEQFDAQAIIDLYADHGTHAQFHSEFKTDLDLERLPSGKFDTNYLVCQLAALAMNILRLIGQRGLLGEDAPVRHQASAIHSPTGNAEHRIESNRAMSCLKQSNCTSTARQSNGNWATGHLDSRIQVFQRTFKRRQGLGVAHPPSCSTLIALANRHRRSTALVKPASDFAASPDPTEQ